mmetsp:Transcript_3575/g.9557  ORF Transcript_3575/g.9557 Transcript_3575/m.9557 type:complete len:385 (-) Transcript_3575:172-1326(-)
MVRKDDGGIAEAADDDAVVKNAPAPVARSIHAISAAAANSEWEAIVADAKKTAPTFRGLSNSVEKARRKRRDAEIVGTDEYELPTEEKVVLLVARSLNDRMSLPGHFYRCLVKEHRARAEARSKDEGNAWRVTEDEKRSGDDKHLMGTGESHSSKNLPQCRDAHFVIHHVMATLIEYRPGFTLSPQLAVKMAAAVEAFVFGELYDPIFAELVGETRDLDEALMKKIGAYEIECLQRTCRGDSMACSRRKIREEDISVEALEALLRLPEARVPSDKLRYCVNFVESISSHFCGSSSNTPDVMQSVKSKVTSGPSMGADSLLKMVCEHIIVGKVPHLNAELKFLEEFATDEHVLKGKEGYALVTLQSSLRFLNLSDDIEHDVITQS